MQNIQACSPTAVFGQGTAFAWIIINVRISSKCRLSTFVYVMIMETTSFMSSWHSFAFTKRLSLYRKWEELRRKVEIATGISICHISDMMLLLYIETNIHWFRSEIRARSYPLSSVTRELSQPIREGVVYITYFSHWIRPFSRDLINI